MCHTTVHCGIPAWGKDPNGFVTDVRHRDWPTTPSHPQPQGGEDGGFRVFRKAFACGRGRDKLRGNVAGGKGGGTSSRTCSHKRLRWSLPEGTRVGELVWNWSLYSTIFFEKFNVDKGGIVLRHWQCSFAI